MIFVVRFEGQVFIEVGVARVTTTFFRTVNSREESQERS